MGRGRPVGKGGFEAGGFLPFRQEFAEALDGGRIVADLPDEDEGDGALGGEGNEVEGGGIGEDALSDDRDTGTRFDVKEHGANEAGGVSEFGNHAGAAAGREGGVVEAHAFASGEENEGLGVKSGPGHGTSAGERMIGPHDDPEGFVPDGGGGEAEGFVADDGAGDGGGEAAFGDHFPDAFGSAFFEVEGDAGVAVAVFGEDLTEECLGGGADVAEAQFAFFAGTGALDALETFLETFQQEPGFMKENGAGRGQTHVVTASFEHGGAEEGFEVLDRAAEGGLGDAEAARGLGIVQVLGDGLEVAQVAKFHGERGDHATASRR